ncbi:DUF1428 family protein [Aquibacillus koreensis]|uniref:DUF1428 family protein n=1 Tax=Aquibacillus koreensis TaxID=279446 RepID=A0A9X3WMV8_9BACI|nr:DUF1428 family protein [Aquibacillus koreensis]MCT2534448.1 DUF1428 family protein [Aquibacillus koreensis]MDC3421755.1 DUF1428 family protein [Aquibacillus koreensis]
MYTNIYFYFIHNENVTSFIDIKSRMADIMLGYGALEDEIYHTSNKVVHKKSRQLLTLLRPKPKEEVMLGQTMFRNKSHFEEVMLKVNADKEFAELNEQFSKIINRKKIIVGAFSSDGS